MPTLEKNLVTSKVSDNIMTNIIRGLTLTQPQGQGRALTLRINIFRTKGSVPGITLIEYWSLIEVGHTYGP